MNGDLATSAMAIRQNILRVAAKAGSEGKGAHIASSLSMVEVMTVLITKIMRTHDVFILSKGHGALAYYAALKEAGIITDAQLSSFEADGGDFPGQPSKSAENGIVFSSGSLGMGLSYACGLALASKRHGYDKMVYVLLGDGELNEGSNWEAVMFAKQYMLNNLVAVVDFNKMQSDGKTEDILNVDLESVFRSFGWQTYLCDGHSIGELLAAFSFSENKAPVVILAKTIKGKGVSFMENNTAWHHNRLSNEQYQTAIGEIDSA